MARLDALADREFDVLIIGAGIYGATLAWHAAATGLSVALIDQSDYGSGASANSLKIIHGGLRYLQTADLYRMRQSIAARREAFACLPEWAHPAPFIVPVGRGLKRSRFAYQLAAWANDLISIDRNRGLPKSHQIPRTAVWSKTTLQQQCPPLQDYDGALFWHDGFIENTERFTLSYVLQAAALGATTRNYVRAEMLIQQADRVLGARVTDVESGARVEIRSRITVHTAGLWDEQLRPQTLTLPPLTWLRAWNLVVRKQWFGDYHVGIDGVLDGVHRNIFFAPWRGHTIIGTVYDPIDPTNGTATLRERDVVSFVEDINRLFPAAELSAADVCFTHVGIQPGRRDKAGRPVAEPPHRSVDIERFDQGYAAIQGVKYTTAAQHTAAVCRRIRHSLQRPDTMPARRFQPLARLPHQHGEAVRVAMTKEQAIHLDDLLLRRLDMGSIGVPNQETIESICASAAQTAGWTRDRIAAEKQLLQQLYQQRGVIV
jgi:glycerol-3-phosphate dehydrogenase